MRFKKFFTLAVLMSLFMILSLQSVMAQDELGSEGNPIQVFFVPSVEAQTITTGGDVMAQALKDATGLNFEVFVLT